MNWIKLDAEIEDDSKIQYRETHALEIPQIGCLITITSVSHATSEVDSDLTIATESTVFVPGVRVRDGKLIAIDGFGTYSPEPLQKFEGNNV